MSIRFTQPCPTCGRRIQIRASLLGRAVACQHCRAEFIAQNELVREPTSRIQSPAETDPLMARVEEALERAKQTAIS